MTSVGSQDTSGPMTRDEQKDLACLGFSADLVRFKGKMQPGITLRDLVHAIPYYAIKEYLSSNIVLLKWIRLRRIHPVI